MAAASSAATASVATSQVDVTIEMIESDTGATLGTKEWEKVACDVLNDLIIAEAQVDEFLADAETVELDRITLQEKLAEMTKAMTSLWTGGAGHPHRCRWP